ncbi:hypothetical protein FB451DRAFT_1170463 [Mycena latifolia]|nr:hypothetical protein FB451DRAFT_1170463 [Mycena latifolia]
MSLADLSLRHLPDLSADASLSFSFQIPADAGDDLLRGDKADFFGNVGLPDSSTPPRTVDRGADAAPPMSMSEPAPALPEEAKSLRPTTRANVPAAPPPCHTSGAAENALSATARQQHPPESHEERRGAPGPAMPPKSPLRHGAAGEAEKMYPARAIRLRWSFCPAGAPEVDEVTEPAAARVRVPGLEIARDTWRAVRHWLRYARTDEDAGCAGEEHGRGCKSGFGFGAVASADAGLRGARQAGAGGRGGLTGWGRGDSTMAGWVETDDGVHADAEVPRDNRDMRADAPVHRRCPRAAHAHPPLPMRPPPRRRGDAVQVCPIDTRRCSRPSPRLRCHHERRKLGRRGQRRWQRRRGVSFDVHSADADGGGWISLERYPDALSSSLDSLQLVATVGHHRGEPESAVGLAKKLTSAFGVHVAWGANAHDGRAQGTDVLLLDFQPGGHCSAWQYESLEVDPVL